MDIQELISIAKEILDKTESKDTEYKFDGIECINTISVTFKINENYLVKDINVTLDSKTKEVKSILSFVNRLSSES